MEELNVPDLTSLRAMEDFAREMIPSNFPRPEIKMGVCTAVVYGPFNVSAGLGTATITLGGAPLPISGVRWLKGAQPCVGDTVVILKSGPDYFIIGTIADATREKAWLTARAIAGSFGTASATIGWTRVSGTPGIVQSGSTFVFARAGIYRVTATVTVQGSGVNWFILSPKQWRGAVNLFTADVVGGTAGVSAFACIPADFIFECQAGDFVQIDINSSAAGNNLDGRSTLVIEEV